MTDIKIGDWALVEKLCGMDFSVGQVICIDDYAIVVKTELQIAVERRDMIQFAGNRKQVLAMKALVDAMLNERREAVSVAEEKVREIAGQRALAIRKLFKQKQKESTP